jgi:hypothetical protein
VVRSRGVPKQWTVVLLSGFFAVVAAVGLLFLGFAPASWWKGLAGVAAAVVALWIKVYLQKLVFGSVSYYKQGYDFCIMTLSTATTSFATEWFGTTGRERLGVLAVIFVGALIGTLATADFAKEIEAEYSTASAPFLKEGKPAPALKEGLRSFFAFIIGISFFIMNIGVVLTKP